MRTVKLSELFDIEKGKSYFNEFIEDDTGINYVTTSGQNQGVKCKVAKNDKYKIYLAGTITVALQGTVLSSFVQTEDFVLQTHVAALIPKKEMTLNEKLYYCMCIQANAFKFGFGRKANSTFSDLEVPAEIPDWVYEVKEPDLSEYKESYDNEIIPELNINNWQEFKLIDLFNIEGSKTTKASTLEEIGSGKYPYITTKSTNNGIEGYFNTWTEKGNVLTIDSACVGTCYYQEENFTASDHVEKLIPKFKMNKYNALFLATVINQSNFKYSYGRGRCKSRLKAETIKLPVNELNEPDYEFMEKYIKSLPYSKHI